MKVAVVKGGQILLTPQFTIDRSIISGCENKGRKKSLRELAKVVSELRQEAKENELDTMPKSEINADVVSARRDLRKSGKHLAI